MSMLGYVADITVAQIAAFRELSALASNFAEISVDNLLENRRNSAFSHFPPEYRQQFEQAKRNLAAEAAPAVLEKSKRLDQARSQLAKYGPFQPILELNKTWHILHFLMTGHSNAFPSPGDALLSGTPVGENLGYGPARLHSPTETRSFSDFLAHLQVELVISRLDFNALAHADIYPVSTEPEFRDAEDWRSEIAKSFISLKSYVTRAAESGDGLLVWLS